MTPDGSIRNKTILVADDDPFYRDVAVAALSAGGYRIKQATNGKDCLDQLACSRLDLVLLDLTMPEISGLDVLRRIRADAGDRPLAGRRDHRHG